MPQTRATTDTTNTRARHNDDATRAATLAPGTSPPVESPADVSSDESDSNLATSLTDTQIAAALLPSPAAARGQRPEELQEHQSRAGIPANTYPAPKSGYDHHQGGRHPEREFNENSKS